MGGEHFVRASDGTNLFYKSSGLGSRSLILCDGLACDGHIWKYLFPKLEQEFSVLHWHYPGHGRSGEPPRFSDLSPSRLGDDMASVARSASVTRATIVGHSMGVQVALETWRRHPDLVQALILVCGSPGNIIHNFHEGPILGLVVPILNVVGRFLPNLLASTWQRMPAHSLAWLAMHTSEINSRHLGHSDLAPYFRGLSRVDFRLALKMLESSGRHDATPYLKKIDVPVLIIAGGDDRFTPASRSKMMAGNISGSEMLMVEGGTHALPLEQPDIVVLRMKKFLAQLA
ncbi:MAG: alpha/beta hydrolase [Deltaproteobacteria bacterium]|nr:alpha/beta hydrolase [Deltaproteobacteria bacterium]